MRRPPGRGPKTTPSQAVHRGFTRYAICGGILRLVDSGQLATRLGLNVPQEWWPGAPLVKSFEAAGFGWTQIHSPPESVLSSPRECAAHAAAAGAAVATTRLGVAVHAPGSLRAGSPAADRAFEGLLAYAADA